MDLALEITRRCNQNCYHCLRGDKQNRNMAEYTIYRAISQADEGMGFLGLTGGEPLIAMDQMWQVWWQIVRTQNYPSSIYIATSAPFHKLERFREWVNTVTSCDVELHVAVSTDKYHEDTKYSYYKLCELIEYYKGVILAERDVYNIICMGKSDYGDSVHIHQESEHPDLYVNVHGRVLPSCDISYKCQNDPRLNLGNVCDSNFSYAKAHSIFLSKYPDGISVRQEDDRLIIKQEVYA